MSECCPGCQSAGIERGLEQRRLERQLEEILRYFAGDLRPGSADCDVNPLLDANIPRREARRALEIAREKIGAAFKAMGAIEPKGEAASVEPMEVSRR